MANKGHIEKLRIEGHKKDKSGKPEKVLYVQVNPEKYSLSFNIQYDPNQAGGKSKKKQKFNKNPPETLSLELIFDRSGMIPKVNEQGKRESFSKEELTNGIQQDIEALKKLMLNMNGKIHRPNSIRIIWGDLIFKGRLKQLDLEYKLFRNDGKPIRAVARTTFVGSQEIKQTNAEENKSSPDLTHLRQTKAGDKLPLMVAEIYEDPQYFLEVAKVNNLVNFRKLKLDQQLQFPPLSNE